MGSPRQPAGLRERKKIRTRETIRRAAAQLIDGKGCANTTVEQIADAAEVSPATFFRYFPTKGSAPPCPMRRRPDQFTGFNP
jgi:AcrR family transcriptional regulator